MMLRLSIVAGALLAATAPAAAQSAACGSMANTTLSAALLQAGDQPPELLRPSGEQPPPPGSVPRTPTPEPTPRAPQSKQPTSPPQPALMPPPRARGQDVNIQIELTISDQAGGETPQKKVVSMLVADATMGRIRASADAQRPGVGYVGTGLNVDGRPTILEGDRILLDLTVEYTPFREGGQVTQRPTVLNESLSIILQNGKPLVISQAADPVTDRRMTVEVRASILK